jgi:hypothetical protein
VRERSSFERPCLQREVMPACGRTTAPLALSVATVVWNGEALEKICE